MLKVGVSAHQPDAMATLPCKVIVQNLGGGQIEVVARSLAILMEHVEDAGRIALHICATSSGLQKVREADWNSNVRDLLRRSSIHQTVD